MSKFVLSETVVTVNESDIEIAIEKGSTCIIRPLTATHNWKTLLANGYTDGDVIETLLSDYLSYEFFTDGYKLVSGMLSYVDLPKFIKLNGLEIIDD